VSIHDLAVVRRCGHWQASEHRRGILPQLLLKLIGVSENKSILFGWMAHGSGGEITK
jgi:hypothetical protein